MRPRPRSSMPGITARQQRQTPSTFTSKVRHHSRASISHAASSCGAIPAFAHRRSTGPSTPSTCATIAATASASETSATTASPSTSRATASTSSRVRALTATRAPALASSRAMLAPIPRPPPVTSATCPSSRSSLTPVHPRREDRIYGLRRRHREAVRTCATHDETVQRLELEALAVDEVVMHRVRRLGGERPRELGVAVENVRRQLHAFGGRERDDLFAEAAVQGPRRRVLADRANLQAGRRRHTRLRADQRELPPQAHADVRDELGGDRRALAPLAQPLGARAPRAVELAEDDRARRRDVLDHARLNDRREHVRDPAEDVLGTDRRRQLLLVVDAVLERDDGGVFAEQRRQQRRRVLGVVGLDAEEDDVARADL